MVLDEGVHLFLAERMGVIGVDRGKILVLGSARAEDGPHDKAVVDGYILRLYILIKYFRIFQNITEIFQNI
jgi:hypothetical protein